MARVSYVMELTINEGKLEEFKEKAEGYVKAVQDGEPGTLVYQWWLGEDGTRCLVHEVFESSEALLTHVGNVGPSLPDLLAIAPITRLEVFGTVSEQAREAVAQLGAKHFPHLAGFER
jgi:quinol monooxygenase YgiN